MTLFIYWLIGVIIISLGRRKSEGELLLGEFIIILFVAWLWFIPAIIIGVEWFINLRVWNKRIW